MDDGGDHQAPTLASRSVVAALIVISRYLDHVSPNFAMYLKEAIDHAASCGVAGDDLTLLRTLLTAVGGDV